MDTLTEGDIFRDSSNLKRIPKMKKFLPPKSVTSFSNHNWLNRQRLQREFEKSLRKMSRDLDSLTKANWQSQYLSHVEPFLRKQDWGEIFKIKFAIIKTK